MDTVWIITLVVAAATILGVAVIFYYMDLCTKLCKKLHREAEEARVPEMV